MALVIICSNGGGNYKSDGIVLSWLGCWCTGDRAGCGGVGRDWCDSGGGAGSSDGVMAVVVGFL